MRQPGYARSLFITLLVCCGSILAGANSTRAQDGRSSASPIPVSDKPEPDESLAIQLYLIVASNTPNENAKMPTSLGPLLRQLRPTTQFANYSLGASLFYRVENKGNLDVNGTGGIASLIQLSPPLPASQTPVFYSFYVRNIDISADASGQRLVRIARFNIGLKVPVLTGVANNAPIVQYQDTGITTGFAIHEGEPAVVGTMNVGQDGRALIVVVSAKRVE